MKQITINHINIYKLGNEDYFDLPIIFENKQMRNINCKLNKNLIYVLQYIARYCELDYKKLKKNDLIKLILDSNCLVYI